MAVFNVSFSDTLDIIEGEIGHNNRLVDILDQSDVFTYILTQFNDILSVSDTFTTNWKIGNFGDNLTLTDVFDFSGISVQVLSDLLFLSDVFDISTSILSRPNFYSDLLEITDEFSVGLSPTRMLQDSITIRDKFLGFGGNTTLVGSKYYRTQNIYAPGRA